MPLIRSISLVAAFGCAAPALAIPIPREAPTWVTPFVHAQSNDPAFNEWIAAFRPRALAAGVEAAIFDAAFDGIDLNTRVLELDASQGEFSKAIWDYLDSAVSDARIRNGQAALQANAAALAQLEQSYGVDAEIIVAIWGLESAYGAVRGSNDTVEALATLAYDGRRGAFFEAQLIEALLILQAGAVDADDLRGSWAGAMGHTQFMPTSYRDYAVDGDDDGRINIWSDDPADALASTANYLREFGWTLGQPWGVEVRLPDGFDYLDAARDNLALPSDWAARGVTDLSGAPVPDHGMASILLPAGHRGPAFMIFDNFEVLENYNTADAYIIGVGHLADRVAGKPAIQSAWPREDRALTGAERRELQRLLTAAGFDTVKVDGLVGPLTINAIRDYQRANGLIPDGYASEALLNRLR